MSDFKCPKCYREFDVSSDDLYHLVTYHGEGDPVDTWCPECDYEFKVKEVVKRTFVIVGEL